MNIISIFSDVVPFGIVWVATLTFFFLKNKNKDRCFNFRCGVWSSMGSELVYLQKI